MRTDEGIDDALAPRLLLSKTKANEVWQKLSGTHIPIILNDIIKALGILTDGRSLKDHINGVSFVDNLGFSVIIYNTNKPRGRQRFTIAHELGHILLEHISADGESSERLSKTKEREADAFAGELLVPAKDLRAYMKNGNRTVEEIIERYDVSKDVAVIAIKDNRLLNKLRI